MSARSRWWMRALPVLAAHGLVPGPDGFDVADLAAFAQERGWQSSTERTGHQGRGRRWRATILTRFAPAPGRNVALSGTHGHGDTEDEALAIALAAKIRQDERLA